MVKDIKTLFSNAHFLIKCTQLGVCLMNVHAYYYLHMHMVWMMQGTLFSSIAYIVGYIFEDPDPRFAALFAYTYLLMMMYSYTYFIWYFCGMSELGLLLCLELVSLHNQYS